MIGYATADEMMAHGAEALHEHVATKMEVAMGSLLPQMEIRFSNLSLGVDLKVDAQTDKQALPTIFNFVKKRYGCAGGKSAIVRKPILRNISGVIKPGSLTLILGQPGSGKSALMKVLSGRFPMEKNVVLEGDISYNGIPRETLTSRLPQLTAYVPQTDTHFPMLTVKETLEFAHACCGGGELPSHIEQQLASGSKQENSDAIDAARAMIKHGPELVLQQLGLTECQDTVVGDAMLRGVSGGERKRVTLGEMGFGFGTKCAAFLDEISTGLDSAATFDIVRTQRSVAKQLRKTVVAALLQPSPEVFELFDDVLVLSDGHVLYHGPREDAVAHFESLGFVCPPHRAAADFLCDLSTLQQTQYESPSAAASLPRSASAFAALFARSETHERMLAAVRAPVDAALARAGASHFASVPEFHQSFWASTRTLMRRQLLVTVRNKAFLRSKLVMVVVMGLLYASTFYQCDFEDVQVVMGILFFSVLYLALTQSPMLPVYFAARDVFYKQRRANLFRASSFVLSVSVSQVPLTLVESAVFGTIVYWLCGFVASVGAFVLFEVLLFLTNLAFSAYFFYLASATTDVHVAKPLGLSTLLLCILFSGFVIARDHIPDYFLWLYWLNPIAWGLRSLAVSQYMSATHDQCVVRPGGLDYCARFGETMGQYFLDLFKIQSDQSWIVYGVLFDVAFYALFMCLAYYALEHKRIETPALAHVVAAASGDRCSASSTSSSGSSSDSGSNGNYESMATPRSAHAKRASATPTITRDHSSSSSTDAAVAIPVAPRAHRHVAPVTVAFRDLWYSVPAPGGPKRNKGEGASVDLLQGVSGFALPGKMTALMGASGAGKTTLLDVIAGRKTTGSGTVRGSILLNGLPATALALGRCTGYCEQMDVHEDSATIREALTFSALLRQASDVPARAKLESVRECLELLGLDAIADRVIRGCSVEQLKRLTIGVELAAQPSVLFLDEPTSGLDARAAKLIMDGVRKVADTGRTVLCTIHQPSTEVFLLFDSLLLLKRGGETVFFGDLGARCERLVEYFEAIPGVPALEREYNPATWMLEVIGAGVDGGRVLNVDADFVRAFGASSLQRELEAALNRRGVGCAHAHVSEAQALAFATKRAASEATQAQVLLQRFFRMYWRLPTYNWTRMVVHVFLGVLFGLIFVDAEYVSYQGINAGLGMLFCMVAFLGLIAVNTCIPVACASRASFYRERASQTYNSLWYFVGFTLAEVPYVVVASLLFTAIFFPLVGFSGGVATAAFFWLNLVLHLLLQTYFGQLLAFALPSVEVAAVIGVLFNSIFVLFTGFAPPSLAMPAAYRWLFAITPNRYAFMLFSAVVFGECSDEQLRAVTHALAHNGTIDMASYPPGCQVLDHAPIAVGAIPIKTYLDRVFAIRHEDIGYYMLVNAVMIVVLRVLALLALRFINHQKK